MVSKSSRASKRQTSDSLKPTRSFSRIVFVSTATVIYLLALFLSVIFTQAPQVKDRLLINDVSRLHAVKVNKVVEGRETETLIETVREAKEQGLKVAIAGKRHSMGGHTFYEDAVLLDMTSYNKIVSVDPKNMVLTVQSGAIWSDVIKELNKYDLSIPVLQDYSSFTVGGSLSVNIHQSDPNYGPIIETVQSFRLLTADGEIVDVSRRQNPELFSLVIGGYGLFGVILDVDLDLTSNHFYKKSEKVVAYDSYKDYFNDLRGDPNIENIFARLSIVPDDTLLRDVVVTTYHVQPEMDETYKPIVEDNLFLKKFVVGISRHSDIGKKLRWSLQSKYSDIVEPEFVTRNNLDYNDASFLDYYSTKDTDILQEYFFPMSELSNFLDHLRAVVEKNDINLLSATIRYVPHNDESFLAYSNKPTDQFGVVLYFNVGLSEGEQEKVKQWTQELIDYAVSIDGTFYLPYELYASDEQLRKAYPNIDEFFSLKKKYDSTELFMNEFYARYALHEDF